MTDFFDTASRVIITCNKRLTPWLLREVADLGFTTVRNFTTGIELKGTLNDCIRLNLNVRCASQILYSIEQFPANHPDDIYKGVAAIKWEQIIPENGYFSITSNVDHPSINNTLYANVKVKDAIVDRMRECTGSRPNSGPNLDGTVVHLFWQQENAEIFLDTSGETLAKHGYRKIPGKAPMLEALAAATILASNWDGRSAFINPMCGSGTLAIEAALYATDRRPGLLRDNYAFMHLVGYDSGVYEHQRQELFSRINDANTRTILATDLSEDAINISKINAAAAGVEHLVQFEVCDFRQTAIPAEETGVVFFNPEYGDRLGVETELEETYSLIGDFLKKQCKGYMGYVFTGNLELAKKIGLKAKRRIEFFNGRIDCQLLEYELYPGSRNPRGDV